jgi:hypothetical protein
MNAEALMRRSQVPDVIHFVPRSDIAAAENVKAFVSLARDTLTAFGQDLRFDDDIWDITAAAATRGLPYRTRVSFNVLSDPDDNSPALMRQPFRQFAKACVRYMHGLKPSKNQQFRLSALRAVEQALAENDDGLPLPHRISVHTLNRAGQIIKAKFTPKAAYRIGGQLELLAELLDEKRLTDVPVRWRNPISRPAEAVRVGKEFERRRQEKLPSASGLQALAVAFRIAADPTDVIISSAAALMCATPDRIGEVLTMRSDCEVMQERSGKDAAYGLRWWPAKGGEPMIKWVIPSMAEIVKEALTHIRERTAAARRIAKWYEDNPGRLYIPEDLEHLRLKAHVDLSSVMLLTGQKKVRQWIMQQGIAAEKQDGFVLMTLSVPF